MPVVVLQSAKDDLRDGYLFYERQAARILAITFSLCSKAICLRLPFTPESTTSASVSIVSCLADSHIRSTTTLRTARLVFTECLTTAVTPNGFTAICKRQKHLNRETANEKAVAVTRTPRAEPISLAETRRCGEFESYAGCFMKISFHPIGEGYPF